MSQPKKCHYRMCHHCGNLNSAEGALVQHCESCAKDLAPFYFFDESRAMGLQRSDYYDEVNKALAQEAEELPLSHYPPVIGLTAYWD